MSLRLKNFEFDYFPDIKSTLDEYNSKKITLPSCPENFLTVEYFKDENKLGEAISSQDDVILPFAKSSLHRALVKNAEVLASGEGVKKLVELTFDCPPDIELDFSPGDTIGILPTNKDSEVDAVIQGLSLECESETPCRIVISKDTKKKNPKVPNFLPQGVTTIRKVLKHCLNIRCIPKKTLMRSLLSHTTDQEEKRFLEILCSKEGGQAYSAFTSITQGFTFLDLLLLCPTCRPPVSILLEHLPRLMPRPYSIANSPLRSQNEIRVVFSLLESPKEPGLTTSMLNNVAETFLENKNEQQSVNLYLRESTKFKLTENDLSKNIILIGVGCAVAPFLGFLEHKLEVLNQKPEPTGKWLLFTGSRYPENAVYRTQFKSFLADGLIDEIFESFSRLPDSEFKYVQDHIRNQAEKFTELLLREETVLFVVADGLEISKNIKNTITESIANALDCTVEEAARMVQDLVKAGKYVEDIWT